MNKKSIYVASMISLSLTTALAGCSESKPSAGTAANGDASKAKKTVSLSMYDRGNIPPEVGTIENNLWTKWIQEKTNMNITFSPVPRGESVQKFNTLFASGSAPNLIQEYDGVFRNQLYNQKQIIPIDDMINKYSTVYKEQLTKFPLLKKLGVKDDGKLYEFGRVLGYVPYHYVLVREDWLKKLNLKAPETTEDLFQIAKAFANQDPDGNGKKDTYGLNLSTTLPGNDLWVDYMFQNTTWVLQDGKWVKDWDRVKAATEFKKKLFDEGIIDKDYLTDKNGKKAQQDFVQGKTGIYGTGGGIRGFYSSAYETLKKNVPDAKLIAIPLPKSSFGQFTPPFNPPVQMTSVVNTSTKDQEAVMKLVDFLSSPDMIKASYFGQEGVHYKLENGKETIINADKNKKEVDWLSDLRMIGGQYLYNEFDTQIKSFDTSKPVEKEFVDLMNEVYKIYINKERPLSNITLGGYMPQLPSDMDFINKTLNDATNPIKDLYNKAIVSGSGYSVEQADQEAKSLWKKSDGDKLEKWYQDWYGKNKDQLVTQKDLFDMNFK
ncbi:putative aldouronate transport system substrate-binding protein [Paenibacillus sp. 1_12]|uniref:extracellular solute-binding protein n=1 Tax=Paenibacillus sp. 1_12 TaxID=1566278 RepID=UPI0008ECFBCE|nr:extracellular solute-binding protein [Paenibacillus sp. 1_12]SFL26190.1 putative aldouronate transport system substrate-binding protein [Paenibacillus sp. 1_12]